ncbi:MAG TPA: hypothetical protein VFU47_18010, partial [Armatimonadota bacterium]|nr:hypothetical protein [Armatimonadota bacterium]
LDRNVEVFARVLGGLSGLSALWLRRDAGAFPDGKPDAWTVLLARGLPFVLLLSAVEVGAAVLAHR